MEVEVEVVVEQPMLVVEVSLVSRFARRLRVDGCLVRRQPTAMTTPRCMSTMDGSAMRRGRVASLSSTSTLPWMSPVEPGILSGWCKWLNLCNGTKNIKQVF